MDCFVPESLLANSCIHLLMFLSCLSLPSPSGRSLQDSFEYINQDPNLGKLNTNQTNLGPCRTGSNLGKLHRIDGSCFLGPPCCGCAFCFLLSLRCCFVLAVSLICVYFCVYLVRPLCCLRRRCAAGMRRQAAPRGGRGRTSPAQPQCLFLCRFVWNAEHGVTCTC